MEQTDRHVTTWDVRVARDYHPYYLLGGGRLDPEPVPPVTVQVSAVFDNNEAAASFEAAVRDLLEKA